MTDDDLAGLTKDNVVGRLVLERKEKDVLTAFRETMYQEMHAMTTLGLQKKAQVPLLLLNKFFTCILLIHRDTYNRRSTLELHCRSKW